MRGQPVPRAAPGLRAPRREPHRGLPRAAALPSAGAAGRGLGRLRGGLGAARDARRRRCRAAARARRAADRAPLGLPPRRPLARRAPRSSARSRGRPRAARPRLRHGRPALAAARGGSGSLELVGAARRAATSCSATTTSTKLRDPFSSRAEPARGSAARRCSATSRSTLELRGRRVQVVGVDPDDPWTARRRAAASVDPDADLRILLCHFPGRSTACPAGRVRPRPRRPPPRRPDLLPSPGGKLRLAHLAARYPQGVYERGAPALHVSAGLGTTFVPFRFFARPEATELVLRCGDGTEGDSHSPPTSSPLRGRRRAREVAGVTALTGAGGVEVDDGRRSSSSSRVDWGASSRRSARRAAPRRRLPRADGRRAAAAVDVVVDESARRAVSVVAPPLAGLTAHARDGAVRLPRLRLVAVPRGATRRQASVDRGGRGRLGRLGTVVLRRRRPRARVDAVRAGASSSRVRRSCRPGRRRTTRSSSRAPTSSTSRRRGCCSRSSWPRSARLATAARARRGVRVPVRRGRVLVRAVPRPQDGVPAGLPRRLRLPPVRAAAASSSRGSSSAGCSRLREGTAREGAARRQGGVRACAPFPRQARGSHRLYRSTLQKSLVMQEFLG